ncbi:MAG: sugar phosphate isomerase/epimerase family protein [Candidatus Hydrogenedentota bacterium]
MAELSDYSRLCIHTLTTKPLSLAESVQAYEAAGVAGITIWREHIEAAGISESAKLLGDSSLEVVSLCRGGCFPAIDAGVRQSAIDDNRKAIEEAHSVGAPLVVLVCGAVPGIPLTEARKQIEDGIAAIVPDAEAAGVRLGIEPLHPMYADTRSAINTVGQAMDIVDGIGSDLVGVTPDVYHLWWDVNLESELKRAGDSIFSFHVNDWRTPTRDVLADRALMGKGCIDIPQIRGWVEEAGFGGFIEVEIFSDEYWKSDQVEYIERIKDAYRAHV